MFLNINGIDHYIAPGSSPTVKIGDMVEAGDVLSSGVPNPAQFTKHKGIGEGRRQFVSSFKSAMKDAGMNGHRRNVEVMSKGLINHVMMSDEYKQFAPDEVVPYDSVEHDWEPRDDSRVVKPSQAIGSYLEKPVLHYTIGTPIKASVASNLDKFGVKDVTIHKNPPPFAPHFVRGMENLQHDPDWMTRMLGSNLKKSTLKAVHSGAVSDEKGTSYVPSLAKAVDFGRKGAVKGFDIDEPITQPDSKGVL